jgi:hypothetical protein
MLEELNTKIHSALESGDLQRIIGELTRVCKEKFKIESMRLK